VVLRIPEEDLVTAVRRDVIHVRGVGGAIHADALAMLWAGPVESVAAQGMVP
jgi:hypothetical protein